jgi:hypothetical protein
MSSRDRKEERLRDNIDTAVERWKRSIEKNERRSIKPEEKQQMKKEFIESARRIDKTKLHEVWNN